jgi:hypothetical protein
MPHNIIASEGTQGILLYSSVAFKEFLAHFGTELFDISEDKISKGNV